MSRVVDRSDRASRMGSAASWIVGLVLVAAVASPAARVVAQAAGPRPVDVGAWQTLLSAHATDDGGFRYAALRESREHRALLERYAHEIGDAQPAGWSRDAQLAFYVNAYNALTVKAVVDRWPIDSVMRVPGFFDRVRHRVAGRDLTLNQLENEVLRSDRFGEPRVHFAINCASRSCPPLSRRAYRATNLEAQLARQTRAFVRSTTRRRGDAVSISRVFEWYAEDFGGDAGVRAFVAGQLDGALAAAVRDPDTPLRHARYDWALNGR